MIRFLKQKPIKIGIYYPLSLALATLACFWFIGSRDILTSAMSSRPYAVLLKEIHFFGLLGEKYDVAPSSGPQKERIICLGDSNFFYPPDIIVPRNENSKIHLSGMILESLGARGVEPAPRISEWSYGGASMFDRYCLFYEAKKFAPDLLVIPITWITLGEPWMNWRPFFRPELSALVPFRSELPKDYVDPVRAADVSAIRQLEHKINLYAVYPIGAKTWLTDSLRSVLGQTAGAGPQKTPSIPESDGGAKSPFPAESEARKEKAGMFFRSPQELELNFPMKIDTSHPVVDTLKALSFLASRHKIKILFFVWPMDSEYLRSVGVFDEDAFEKSKTLLREEVGSDYTYFADLSNILEHEDFHDWRGHCAVEGRRKVAEALAPKILEILEEDDDVGAD